MFGIFFWVFVLAALLGIANEIAMRVRLTRRASDKWAWWRRGGDEVAASYEQLFPNSLLPRYRRLMFWGVLAFAALLLAIMLRKSH
jgi:hypothetical protein